jgi:hypothetical protein
MPNGSVCLAFTQGVFLRVISPCFTRSSRNSSSQRQPEGFLKTLSPRGTVSIAEEVAGSSPDGYIMARILGVQMVHEILHELFQWHAIHEVLHLLSGCVGSFFGTWVYFVTIHRRRIEREP